jgi:glycosyltransferase involved in cell wall biosynthesis
MEYQVSVIIPTYNYGRFIAEAIRSALCQTYGALEIIVIDDGSTDDTASLANSFGTSIRYFRQENMGVCAARNRGVLESNGKFIAFLDADDIWEPTKIEKQVAKFGEDPEIGLVHCGMREFDSATGATVEVHLEGAEGWLAEDIALSEQSVIVGPGGTIMVSRQAFEDVGGFDTRLKNGEDWEFCFRVATKYKIGFVPEVLVEYRSHGVNASKNIREMERSTLIAWEKVFTTNDEAIRRLRRRSYGNLHKVLAGSYLHKREYVGFIRNVLKSLWYRPSYFAYYLALPIRRNKILN